MKKKLVLAFFIVIAAAAFATGLVACGNNTTDEHTLSHVSAVDATCTEDGNIEYWHCSECGKYFSDADAKTEIKQTDTVAPAKGHTFGEWEISKPATCTEDGTRERKCTACQYEETETLYATGHDIRNNVCTHCGTAATEGLRFQYVQGDGIEGVFCIGWDESHAEGHGDHDEADYGTLDLIIPDVYEGYSVIGVSEEWSYSFLNDLCIRSVTLPDSVIYIGDQAFSDCEYLQSVSVGPALDYLGERTFENTAFENSADNYEDGLLYLVSRDRETKWLVKAQKDIADAVLAENTMFVAADAFSDCDGTLSSITFGTSIPVFYGGTFTGFDNLKEVYYNGTLEDWVKIEFYSDTANPLCNGADLYLNGTLLTEVVTPSGMTKIRYSFVGCTSIESAVVSEGVNEIGNGAFAGCSNLSTITLPDSLISIGNDAFKNCAALTSVTLPKNLSSIGSDAFIGCRQLSSIQIDAENTSFAVRDGVLYDADFTELVYIPEGFSGVLQLPDGVDLGDYNAIRYFDRCENLTGIEVSEDHLYHKSSNGIVYSEPDEYGSQFMYVAPGISGKIELPDDIVAVSGFSDRDITEILFGKNTKRIEDGAFENCTQITGIVIPDSVTYIGTSAFSGCTALKTVVIGNGVTTIGYQAFKGCPLESAVFKHYTGWDTTGDGGVTEEQLKDPAIAAELLPDEKYDGWINAGTYRVDFVIDGAIAHSITYTLDAADSVIPPQIPAKEGYDAAWEEYSLTGDVVVNAIYTAIPYTVTFLADGRIVSEQSYTVEDYGITVPAVPAKAGYTGKWDRTFAEGTIGDITINAVYDILTYTITFVADGEIIAEDTYTVEDYDIVVPAVPAKKGYDGKWDHTLAEGDIGDITVNADYTLIVYTVTFIDDGGNTVAVEHYTVENYEIDIPELAQKTGYRGQWRENVIIDEDFELAVGRTEDIEVTAVYEIITYTVTFVAQGETVAKETYTVENHDITPPAVPLDIDYLGVYEGVWENFELTVGNITVNALYSTCGATEGIRYTLSDDGKSYSVTGYSGTDPDILIPDLYQNKPVVALEWNSFVDNDTIETVKISNGITDTMGGVFMNCSNLKTVYIPISLQTTALASPFSNCPNLQNVYCESAEKPISWLFDTTESYWKWGYNNISRQEFDYVTHIGINGYEAYLTKYNGTSKDVNIPSSFGNYKVASFTWIFAQNPDIESVTFPESIKTIFDYAFYECTGLKKAAVSGIFSELTSIGRYAFYNCSGLTGINFLNNVVSVGNSAFYGCGALDTLIFGNSLESIGPSAFAECVSLTEVYMEGVISIDLYAFQNCTALTEVTFGERLNTIGESAFAGCTSLIEICLPDSVTQIGESAFRDCTALEKITLPFIGESKDATENAFFGYIFGAPQPHSGYQSQYVPKTLKTVIVTDTDNIAENAFLGCQWIESITIPENVTRIGDYAFSGCDSLNDFMIPASVTELGNGAFAGCSSFTTLVLPDELVSIGDSAFSDCISLESLTIPEGVTDIGFSVFSGCSSVTEIVLPYGITELPSSLFYGCGSLENFVIPGSVTSIGHSAFGYCSALTGINIPASVKDISEFAFVGCRSLSAFGVADGNAHYSDIDGILFNKDKTFLIIYPEGKQDRSYTIPDHVLLIQGNFSGNKYLESVKIGSNIGGIGTINAHIFDGCINLSRIDVSEDNAFFCSIDGVLFNKDKTTLLYYPCGKADTLYEVPEGTIEIAASAFSGNGSLVNIVIPDSVILINSYAFSNCGSLETVALPQNLTFIANGTFGGCVSLRSVEIPAGVKSIENGAFHFCGALRDLVIPDGIVNIADDAFTDCTALENVTMPTSAIPYIPKHSLKTVVLTSGDTISGSAFLGCDSLTSITLPESLTSIGDAAFLRCYHLAEVFNLSPLVIEKGSKENGYIGYYAVNIYNSAEASDLVVTEDGFVFFEDGEQVYLVRYEGSAKDLVLPESFNGKPYEILPYAFSGNYRLTNVTIPGGVTKIGFGAFYNCFYIESITLPFIGSSADGTGDTHFGSLFGAASYSDNKTCVPNTLKNVIVTGGTTVGNNSFFGCSLITSITLPDSITAIQDNAFNGCSSLQNINIPQNVERIGGGAFSDCTSLTSIVVPNNATEIGQYAFFNCSALETAVIGNGVKTIGNSAFANCSALTNVAMGQNVETIGAMVFQNCGSLTSITIPESVTEIGICAFLNCYMLTEINFDAIACKDFSVDSHIFRNAGQNGNGITVNIGANVKRIPAFLFYGEGSFISPKIIAVNFAENSVCESIGKYAFASCGFLTGITIPDSVTSIEERSFRYCSMLANVSIGNKISFIGHEAFMGCPIVGTEYDNAVYLGNQLNPYAVLFQAKSTEISSCTINEDTRVIYCSAFAWCVSLRDIVIPANVLSIGSNAFMNCNSLKTFTIPSNVANLGREMFANCTLLESIEVAADNAYYSDIDGVLFNKDQTVLICYPCGKTETSYEVPEGIVEITSYAFFGNGSLVNIVIPEGAASIGDSAFSDCIALTHLTLPNSITHIGDYVFQRCNSFTIAYNGTAAEWENIAKGPDWDLNTTAYVIQCTDGDITKE